MCPLQRYPRGNKKAGKEYPYFFKASGQGAWILSMFLLPRYVDRFDNLQTKLASNTLGLESARV
jgi:hypothetical protein